MRLSFLLNRIGLPCLQADTEIRTVTDEVGKTGRGSLFVCIRGATRDGGDFAGEAISRGAAAVIAETSVAASPQYRVKNARLAFSLLCAALYGDPQNRLRLVGVTGTNGKTTTVRYLQAVLEGTGRPCAVLGTQGFSCGGSTIETGYTTPKSDVFFRALKTAADRGCFCAAAEISSQALAQYRTDGARCTLGIVTNLGRDHLDYHKTPGALAAAKARLCALSDTMLLNADDPQFPFFLRACAAGAARTFGTERPADFSAEAIRLTPEAAAFTFVCRGGRFEVRVPAPGRYSVYNALAALSAAFLLGVEPAAAAKAAQDLPAVEGRAQFIRAGNVRVCVDFAHTPQALGAVLEALSAGGGRIVTVFGCGGDRDPGKRPEMGRIAARYSAAAVLTSDNPRSEDPLAIIDRIRAGIPAGTAVFCEPDRERAIRLALSMARPGDTVLIAGKGHETTQTVGNETRPFSDAQVVRTFLAENGLDI